MVHCDKVQRYKWARMYMKQVLTLLTALLQFQRATHKVSLHGSLVSTSLLTVTNYTVSQKKGDTILLSISLLNIDRFSLFFHRHTQLEICNKIMNKDPTSPQMCCYTTL